MKLNNKCPICEKEIHPEQGIAITRTKICHLDCYMEKAMKELQEAYDICIGENNRLRDENKKLKHKLKGTNYLINKQIQKENE